MNVTKWKKPMWRGFILYYSSYRTFWRRWNHGYSKRISGHRKLGEREGYLGGGQRSSGAGKLLCALLQWRIRSLSLSTPTERTPPAWTLTCTVDSWWWRWATAESGTATHVPLVGVSTTEGSVQEWGQGICGNLCNFCSILLWTKNCSKKSVYIYTHIYIHLYIYIYIYIMQLPYSPEIALLGIYIREIETYVCTNPIHECS